MDNIQHIGILGAMPEEVINGLKNLVDIKESTFGDLTIYSGNWINNKEDNNIFISLAWSGWGKVSASRAATRLLSLNFNGIPKVSTIIFNGVAGSANSNLSQWDIVIPSELIQYDMDARPIFEKFVIPALKASRLKVNSEILNWTHNTIGTFLKKNYQLPYGHIHTGLIGTGDKFISEEAFLDNIKKDLPDLKAIEMEGGAVAQVAIQEGIPWIIIRVISDDAKSSAANNFKEFLEYYEKLSWVLINCLLSNWPEYLIKNKNKY